MAIAGTVPSQQLVFGFDHPHERAPRELSSLLGGKGGNLAEMTSVLALPVPPGFTISTDAWHSHRAHGWSLSLAEQVESNLASLEARMGRSLGDPIDPLLVSVRSGARYSMPGMMDTVLNLGLNDESVRGLAELTGDERFANDSYRRFIHLFGRIVLGIDGTRFDEALDRRRLETGAATDSDLDAEILRSLVEEYQQIVEDATGRGFPQHPADQLQAAIRAVFASWDSPRAITYRRREGIPENLGTAVNVQAMVFGNRNDRSGTGVAFTRDPSTGDPIPYGDFLVNAQGEDVVAGVRRTLPLSAMGTMFPDAHAELLRTFEVLEGHYRDLLDIEFTVEEGRLWLLQTRVGKRTGEAAVRIAVALTSDPSIRLSREEAVRRVTPAQIEQLLHPRLEETPLAPFASGLAASPGGGVGAAYFDADRCVEAAGRGEAVVLVRPETSAEDVHAIAVAEAVLTTHGGLVSHAAVVARGWGKPAVCGVEDLQVDASCMIARDGTVIEEGTTVSVDGTTGHAYLGELPLVVGEPPPELDVLLDWADAIRAEGLDVRANADTPEDARRARRLGAEGIGLCRTEHMFLGDRLPVVRRMILATTEEEEQAALDELRRVQQIDFEDLLEAMDGLPVTIRLLDPPLHEFLPVVDSLLIDQARGQLDAAGEELLAAAIRLKEQNPMLGLRGVRLGIIRAGLYRMQVRALLDAARSRLDRGGSPRLEIMVPLVVDVAELQLVRTWITDEINRHDAADLDIRIGTMIETPRAAMLAGEIAWAADFFSFGTNDLTQLAFGLSRDDVGPILDTYLAEGILDVDPFRSLDELGVGELVELAVVRGRQNRPELKLSTCGEHGGDPSSIAFFHRAGLDVVSCSPFRVPIARLAAAHAVLDERAPDRR